MVPSQDGQAAHNAVFLPTGALQLFTAMHSSLQRHHLIACDFDSFASADVQVGGVNAPIISGKVSAPLACTQARWPVGIAGDECSRVWQIGSSGSSSACQGLDWPATTLVVGRAQLLADCSCSYNT
jgi:hypothetical protein